MFLDVKAMMQMVFKATLSVIAIVVGIVLLAVAARAEDTLADSEPDGTVVVYFDKTLNRVAGVKCVGQTACDVLIKDVSSE